MCIGKYYKKYMKRKYAWTVVVTPINSIKILYAYFLFIL